jgi:hypothetical protein
MISVFLQLTPLEIENLRDIHLSSICLRSSLAFQFFPCIELVANISFAFAEYFVHGECLLIRRPSLLPPRPNDDPLEHFRPLALIHFEQLLIRLGHTRPVTSDRYR